jgi:hypothetical protein
MDAQTQPKVTQRQRKAHAVVEPPPERLAYTVSAFCLAHAISRSYLYKLWADGCGPKKMERLGRGKILISVEAARQWRRDMENHGRDFERE